jgi:hypothetical protein
VGLNVDFGVGRIMSAARNSAGEETEKDFERKTNLSMTLQ